MSEDVYYAWERSVLFKFTIRGLLSCKWDLGHLFCKYNESILLMKTRFLPREFPLYGSQSSSISLLSRPACQSLRSVSQTWTHPLLLLFCFTFIYKLFGELLYKPKLQSNKKITLQFRKLIHALNFFGELLYKTRLQNYKKITLQWLTLIHFVKMFLIHERLRDFNPICY